MSPVARAYHSSERAITGSVRSIWRASGMDMTSSLVSRTQGDGDAPHEMRRRKPFTLEHVGDERRCEPAAGEGDRVQSNGDLVRRRHFGHDRREAPGRKVVFDGDDQL